MFSGVTIFRKAAENTVSSHPGLVHVKQLVFSEEEIEDEIAKVYQFRKLFSEIIYNFPSIRRRNTFCISEKYGINYGGNNRVQPNGVLLVTH